MISASEALRFKPSISLRVNITSLTVTFSKSRILTSIFLWRLGIRLPASFKAILNSSELIASDMATSGVTPKNPSILLVMLLVNQTKG